VMLVVTLPLPRATPQSLTCGDIVARFGGEHDELMVPARFPTCPEFAIPAVRTSR
jgi:hypothetical protein